MYSILPEEKNPALRRIAQALPLKDIRSARVQKLIGAMKDLLAKEKYGVALAAPQLGEPLQIFIVAGRAIARGSRNAPDEHGAKDVEEISSEPDQVYINPTLDRISKKRTDKHEGCLSIRGKWGLVPRAEKATVTAYDENARKFTRNASGFLAHIFQHEMDHLSGILYTDKASEVFDEDNEQG